jgi:hypothetical protein
MTNSPTPTKQPKREAVIEALAHWLSTPVSLREPRSLNQLASQLGVHAGGRFYALAKSPEVCYRMLMQGGGQGMLLMPDVLSSLAQMAVHGNVAAADTYLRHIRFILTDERIMKALTAKPRDIYAGLREASEGAKEMLAFVRSLPSSGGDN